MGLLLENEEKLISAEDEAKLRRIANRITKANKEVNEMGYDSYISGTGRWIIMNGDTHNNHAEPCRENAVASFLVDKVAIGEW